MRERINLKFSYYFGKIQNFPTRGRKSKVKDFVVILGESRKSQIFLVEIREKGKIIVYICDITFKEDNSALVYRRKFGILINTFGIIFFFFPLFLFLILGE